MTKLRNGINHRGSEPGLLDGEGKQMNIIDFADIQHIVLSCLVEILENTHMESNGQGLGAWSVDFCGPLIVAILSGSEFQSFMVLGKKNICSSLCWCGWYCVLCYLDVECDAKLAENVRWVKLNDH